jgi:hypothetical protein
VAILREVHYKGCIYLDIANVCAAMHGFKMLCLKTTRFKHVEGIICL